jgi:RNA polymerase sigma factor (sigma-70 family)
MAFPDTPATLLSQLKDPSMGTQWHDSWRKFFDLYHGAIRASVRRAFGSHGWHSLDDTLLQETIADVVISFCKNQQKTAFDSTKGRLRSHLYQLAQWRVKDQIRRQQRSRQETSLSQDHGGDLVESNPEIQSQWMPQWLAEEEKAYQIALLHTLIEDVRSRISPRNWLIFDLAKLQQKKPDEIAQELRVNRHVVDNAVYKVMQKFKELASTPEYRQEAE